MYWKKAWQSLTSSRVCDGIRTIHSQLVKEIMNSRLVRIGLIQNQVTEDIEKNLEKTLSLTKRALAGGAQVVCLQELFRTPYFPRLEHCDAARYAETIPGESTDAFAVLSREHEAVIIVPIYERSSTGGYYNTAVVIDAGQILLPPYRKVHIPHDPFFYEKNYFSEGERFRVYDTSIGRISVLICYDQWFPEPARAVVLEGADLIFYPTAIGWVKGMEDPLEGDWHAAWETVQRGHAIANGIHIAAVNRVGVEGELSFWGGSFVSDAFGNLLARAGDKEEIVTAVVDLGMNEVVRRGWGFLRNRRPSVYYRLTQPGTEARQFFTGDAGTPKKEGFSMPAEWEPHDAVWLSWPYDNDTFPQLHEVEQSYIRMIRELHSGEQINLLVKDGSLRKRVESMLLNEFVDLSRVTMHIADYADVWFRDYGPTFVVNRNDHRIAMVQWDFNAWGNKYPGLLSDRNIPGLISEWRAIQVFSPGIILEGGSFDVNGRGTLLTTEQCLLNQNRNPGLSRKEIEAFLCEYLGVSHVIWLKEGIAGDDTDGHIDDVARFVDERTVICAFEEEPSSINYIPLMENYRRLKKATDQDGNPLRVIPIPMPGDLGTDACLPASYTNFYIGNHTVLFPTFGTPDDGLARMILEGVFPGRTVTGIDCRAMVQGLGTIHCISQQQPAP